MAHLTIPELQDIKTHMISDDEKTLTSKFKSRKNEYDTQSIDLNEIDDFEKNGWEVTTRLKHKAKVQRRKPIGRLFEDRIWCMFYGLGFKTLNYDENLSIRWGKDSADAKQLDIIAVGDDAIFVVECKAADKPKSANFKVAIDEMEMYKDGITKALKQIYGEEKKVKFIFATHNYRFSDNSEDIKRLSNKKIYHFNENSYNYVTNLINAYKSSVMYQFHGLMFKNEIINSERIRIPALKGTMGGKDYYMLSIEPSTLLKVGFVLHRTKVNDSMAPTYQRLLVPSRLKGITKFIDEGGYFPNSIIVNFDSSNKKLKVQFEPAGKAGDSQSRFGTLSIPNAYGIAYIIDGQHRVYGYAGSKFKNSNTIPVVAFVDMESQEQLKIFMDINENQKAVSPSLRLDLAEDINWESERADSRMLALRSSIIKVLSKDSNSVLYTKISVGEDNAKLTFKPFDDALSRSSLLPKAAQKSYTQDQDVCLYDCNNLDNNKAMNDAKKRIANLIRDGYSFMQKNLNDDLYDKFIECNRGTYAFVVLIGSLNKHLIHAGLLTQKSTFDEQLAAMAPFLNVLIEYLKNIPNDHRDKLLLIKGAAAEKTWLHMFQDPISKAFPEYNPDGLAEWRETQDENLQQEAKEAGDMIEKILHKRVLEKQQELFGKKWERNMFEIKTDCLKRMSEQIDEDDINEEDWLDFINVNDLKSIIEKNWLMQKEDDEHFKTFADEFSIFPVENSKSRKERLKWLTNFITYQKSWTSTKGKPLTQFQVNELHSILESLLPSE